MTNTNSQEKMQTEKELIIHVNSADQALAPVEKREAHQGKGQLHRAITVFLVNDADEILLTQRSAQKPLWPLWWDAACSTHQWWPDEPNLESAARRLPFETGITADQVTNLHNAFKYEYHAVYSGEWAENEINHILVGTFNGDIIPNPAEVAEWKWQASAAITEELVSGNHKFAPWFKPAWELFQRSRGKEWC